MNVWILIGVILLGGIPLLAIVFSSRDKKAYDTLYEVCEEQEKKIAELEEYNSHLNEVVETQRRRNDILAINLGDTIAKLEKAEDRLLKFYRPRNEKGQYTKITA